MMSRPVVGVDMRALVGTVSGIGFYTRSLLDRLANRQWADYIGMAHAGVVGQQRLEESGVRFECRSAPLGVLWQQLLLPGRLRRGDVDLFWSPLLTLPLASSVPGVVTIHDLTPLLHPKTHTLKVRMSILPFLRQTVAQAARIVADSEATARDIRQHFPRSSEKIRVVYPGIDTEFVPGSDTAIAATRHELGCQDGFILSAGTLEPRKNVGFLLDAWEALKEEEPSTPRLVLVGGYGWRSRSLLDRIKRLEQTSGLVYLERIERARLVRVFQAASIFVMPSLYEGFGLPAAEAMACGVPTVVTRTSSLPEVVGDAHRLISDDSLATDIGARCQTHSRQFDWNRSAEQIEQVFREALGE
jgi:glycosyltransferase involved in cell wall biosynthesis